MKTVATLLDWEKKVKRFVFNEKWFPILVIILLLLLSGWDSKTNIREGLLSVGFFLLGFAVGCLYTAKQFEKILFFIRERADMLIEDLVADLSRYALIAGESYDRTKQMIHRYKEEAKSILTRNQKN
jgi:energy-coupling factor transporter transmembrane protein EcfT